MFFKRLLASFDCFISAFLRLSSSGTRPGSNGAASECHYYDMIGPRYVIFREGKVHAIGGFFGITHRYDASGALLSRERRFKAEFQEGDALLFGYKTSSRGLSGKSREGGITIF